MEYLAKKGLVLLLNCSKVTFTQLTDEPSSDSKVSLTKRELLDCLNPIAIWVALDQENKEWLQFLLQEHYDKKVPFRFNPISKEEFLGKLISYKLAVLNYCGSSNLQARYIFLMKTLLIILLKFPDKLLRVKEQFTKSPRSFFVSFDVVQNFTSGYDVSALREPHKYKLKSIIANQTFALLGGHISQNTLGNVVSIIYTGALRNDAEMIETFLQPEFTKHDIIHLDNYKFILNTQYDNKHVSTLIFNSIPY